LLKKNKARKSQTQRNREQEFTEQMGKLFDISHKQAKELIRIAEDRIFLEDQRGPRQMKMAGIDKKLAEQEERTLQRKVMEEKRTKKEEKRKQQSVTSSVAGSDEYEGLADRLNTDSEKDTEGEEDTEEECDKFDNDYEIEIPIYHRKQLDEAFGESSTNQDKTPRLLEKILSSPDVASTLDRINLSDRKFVFLAAAIAKANDEDLSTAPLSHSTVHRKRSSHQSAIASDIRQEFMLTEKAALVVHWDGKIMKDTTHHEDPKSTADRLAVSVTGVEIEKILGILKLTSGTGAAQASATFELLKLWEVSSEVIGFSFDTTASNTGSTNGACTLLEQKLQRNILHFACRHHVHELIIGGVFTALFGPSKSPNIALFERFQRFWPNIDQHDYKPLDDLRLAQSLLHQLHADVTSFLKQFLAAGTGYIPREDYKEIIELCLLILGEPVCSNDESYHFRIPGAYHLARWMGKVIYCFKIYLFRHQFHLTPAETRHLLEFCLFASHIYVRAWISCPVPCDAPVNDLLLFQQIVQYSTVSKQVSDAAKKKFVNHLWYLGPELVPLCLFSEKVFTEAKQKICEAMLQCGEDWRNRGIKLQDSHNLENKELHELVAASSTSALRCLGVEVELLTMNPAGWTDSPLYDKAKSVVDSIKVVNDSAERTVALMSSYNESITKNESEMQRLVQVVEDNRKRIPDYKKTTLKQYETR
jgi:hypothetical protein